MDMSKLQVKGLFGLSILALHTAFLLDVGVVIDDLHGLYLLGVSQTLLDMWFLKQCRGCAFYIGDQVCTSIQTTCKEGYSIVIFFVLFYRLMNVTGGCCQLEFLI